MFRRLPRSKINHDVLSHFMRLTLAAGVLCCHQKYWLTRNGAVVALLHAILPDALPGVNFQETLGPELCVHGRAQALLGGVCGHCFINSLLSHSPASHCRAKEAFLNQ